MAAGTGTRPPTWGYNLSRDFRIVPRERRGGGTQAMPKVVLAILFLGCDIAVGVALVTLLCLRGHSPGDSVEWALTPRRRRRWYLLVALAGLAYFSLAPVFLAALIRSMNLRPAPPKPGAARHRPHRAARIASSAPGFSRLLRSPVSFPR